MVEINIFRTRVAISTAQIVAKWAKGPETCWSKPQIAQHGKEEKQKDQDCMDYISENGDSSSSNGGSSLADDEYNHTGFHISLEDDTKKGHFLAVKRGAYGQPIE